MANITHNHIYLCPEHHRGKYSPHMNRGLDLELKKSMQSKLEELFNRKYYNIREIQELLGCSGRQAENIIKNLSIYKDGFKKEDLLRKMMGGRLY